ncbi:MAG: hypothetical protein HQL12_08065 [Candidatus Omnitrophica bacterium]|nr:hypothetical protein [Candidatus Omnitrophota bacterium]
MNKLKWVMMMAGIAFVISGCATIKEKFPLDVDRTAQSFFNDLQKSDNRGAYSLFGKGLSQRVSFDQFDQFMKTIREQWGRIETDDTALLPFHQRMGEADFIPLNVAPQQIKRYVFDVKFQNAEMNFDLTLAPEGDSYKIIWFSVWGSSIYMTPQVRAKIEELFSKPGDAGQ